MDRNFRSGGVCVAVFFTWDVSLKIWADKGLLSREVLYYQRMAERGVKIIFVTWGDQDDLQIARTHDLHENIEVIPVYTLLKPSGFKLLRFLQSFQAAFRLAPFVRRADVLKTNQMWGSWVAVVSKILSGKPLILRSGFELYRFSVLERQRALRRAFVWVLSFIAYWRSDLIYVATQEDADFARRTFFVGQKKRVEVRPNWIDTEMFRHCSVEGFVGDLLFVGRLNAQKNLEFLLSALAGTSISLTIAGDGELLGRLEEMARDLGIYARFLGSVPNAALPELYCAHRAFVLASHYEGNPKSLLEAMACGCAVIGADVEGIHSVISHDVDGLLFPPGDAEGMRSAVSRVMGDDALRGRLGAAARARIVGTQSLPVLLDKELSDYEAILHSA